MSSPRFDQARPFAVLAALAVGWLVLPVAVKSLLRASFFEFTAPVTQAASHVRDLQEYWSLRLHTKNELIEAGRDLARVNASYDLSVQETAGLQAEVGQLEEALRLPAPPGFRAEAARVVRRDFSSWWQSLVIRKGRDYGIAVGAPVVFTGGAVGRVAEVHATTSVVELISSPGVRIAASFEGDPRIVSFQGGINPAFGPARGEVQFIPLDIPAHSDTPRRIVTSGLGGVFPAGLTLGMIDRIEPSADGLFESGEVRLDPRLAELVEVTVLVPLAPDQTGAH